MKNVTTLIRNVVSRYFIAKLILRSLSARSMIVTVNDHLDLLQFKQLAKNLFYDLADAEQIFVNYNVQQPVDTDI